MSAQLNDQQKEPVQKETEDSSTINFERLRKKVESLEKGKQASDEKAANLERQLAEFSKKKTKDPEPTDEDHYDEPYVDEKRLNKKLEKFEQRVDRRVDEIAETKARSLFEQERNAAFLRANPDFNEVLSPEVIEKFAKEHSAVAEQMLEIPDGFARQKLLYQSIKALGAHKTPEPKPSIQETIDSRRKGPFYQPSSMGTPPYGGVGAGKAYSETEKKSAFDQIQALKARLRL